MRFRKPKTTKIEPTTPSQEPVNQAEIKSQVVSADLHKNLDILQKTLGGNADVIFRQFNLGFEGGCEACIVYIDGTVDKTILDNNIFKSLILETCFDDLNPPANTVKDMILGTLLTSTSVKVTGKIDDLISYIVSGQVVLLVNSLNEAFVVDIRAFPQRALSEPPSEVTVRGPRSGFTETLRTNTALIRGLIHSPNLVFESHRIGRVSATDLSLVYIKGIASPEIIAEVRQRLAKIDIDGILGTGYIEELIEDEPYSPFPQMLHTERPDRVAGGLLEGRVAILVDGTPFALILPIEITAFLTAPEDYYERALLATATRWVRYIAFAMSLLLPSIYIAITTFHQEMIPAQLLNSISASRQGVPFPALVEALIMEFVFEVLREAGIRLPRAIGQTVSIAGAIVIGQSGVQAGVVSPLMVIVVATTGIASFTVPSYNLGISVRLLRFPLMLLAGTMGLYGIILGIIVMTVHVMKLRSFGVPFTSSFAPLHLSDLKDVFVRVPWWAMDERPVEIAKSNRRRQAPGMKPGPPDKDSNKGGDRP